MATNSEIISKLRNDGKYYIYRHVRLDNNKVFYIGIGSKTKKLKYKTHREIYNRAYTKGSRSLFWKSIITKSNYKIQILLESDDYEFIKDKEKEFIKLYGRRDLKQGTLCNLTDGGEGLAGRIYTKEMLEKHINACSRGNKHYSSKITYQYDMTGNLIKTYDCILNAAKEKNVTHNSILISINTKRPCKENYYSHILYNNYLQENAIKEIKSPWNNNRLNKLPIFNKQVLCFNKNGTFLKEFNNTIEALNELNIPIPKNRAMNKITRNILGHAKYGYEYIWKYKI